jgi:hypothetical protein
LRANALERRDANTGRGYDASVGKEEEEVDEEEREEATENEDEEVEDEGREEEGREEEEEDEEEENENVEDEDGYGYTISKHGNCDAAAGSNACSPCFS